MSSKSPPGSMSESRLCSPNWHLSASVINFSLLVIMTCCKMCNWCLVSHKAFLACWRLWSVIRSWNSRSWMHWSSSAASGSWDVNRRRRSFCNHIPYCMWTLHNLSEASLTFMSPCLWQLFHLKISAYTPRTVISSWKYISFLISSTFPRPWPPKHCISCLLLKCPQCSTPYIIETVFPIQTFSY